MAFFWEEGPQRVKTHSSSSLCHLTCPTAEAASCGLVTFSLYFRAGSPSPCPTTCFFRVSGFTEQLCQRDF